MKKLIVLLITVGLTFGVSIYAFSATDYIQSDVSGTVETVFSIEFYPRSGIDNPDPNIQFPNGNVSFGTIDPLESTLPILPTGRVLNDGKSDVGLLCLSNRGDNFAVKIAQTGTANRENLIMYLPPTAYNRNTDPALEIGGIQFAEGWRAVPKDTPETIYLATGNENTIPWGSLITLSFGIIPSGKLDWTDEEGQGLFLDGDPLPSGPLNITIWYQMTTDI